MCIKTFTEVTSPLGSSVFDVQVRVLSSAPISGVHNGFDRCGHSISFALMYVLVEQLLKLSKGVAVCLKGKDGVNIAVGFLVKCFLANDGRKKKCSKYTRTPQTDICEAIIFVRIYDF